MINYTLRIKRRAEPNQSYQDLHRKFLERIYSLGQPWDLKALGCLPDIGDAISLTLPLDEIFNNKLQGNLCYLFRSNALLEDVVSNDDFLYLDLNLKTIDFFGIISRILPKYISAFQGYRATIFEEKIALRDYSKIVQLRQSKLKDTDGRDSVYRINSVNYFDRELCRRAFQLSPEQMVERLKDHLEYVTLLNDGIYFVYSSQILPAEELVLIDAKVRQLLDVPIETSPIDLSEPVRFD